MERSLKELSSSPLFHLSLSSKELFHSNFFAWLANSYPEILGNALAKEFNIEPFRITDVRRERNKIDLAFNIGTKHIVFENKVKSRPNFIQLRQYREKYCDATFRVLLSMIAPDFETENIGWRYWPYSEYLSLLESIKSQIQDQYHNQLLLDYISFTQNLCQVVRFSVISEDSQFYDDYFYKIGPVMQLRIHDIFIKSVIEQFGIMVRKKLLEVFPEAVEGNELREICVGDRTFFLNKDFLNGKGIFTLELRCKGYYLGFMVEHDRWLQYIVKWEGHTGLQDEFLDFSTRLASDSHWFNRVGERPLNSFNKYRKGDLLYKYEKISPGTTFGQLTNDIIYEMKQLIKKELPALC